MANNSKVNKKCDKAYNKKYDENRFLFRRLSILFNKICSLPHIEYEDNELLIEFYCELNNFKIHGVREKPIFKKIVKDDSLYFDILDVNNIDEDDFCYENNEGVHITVYIKNNNPDKLEIEVTGLDCATEVAMEIEALEKSVEKLLYDSNKIQIKDVVEELTGEQNDE